MEGDRRPYVFKTTNFGKSWSPITAGVPAGQYARTVRQDPKNPDIVYLGTELGLYASQDAGAHWKASQQNLPPVSVRDIQIQPDFNDLLLATHGRDAWILDDLTPVQQLSRAQTHDAYVFPVRPAYLYEIHGESNKFTGAGEDPPYGAIFTFYLKTAAKANPTAEVLDSHGHVIRHFNTHQEDGISVPDLTNQAGLNRASWDLTEEKPVAWNDSPSWDQFNSGAIVLPGRYTIVIHDDKHTLHGAVDVMPDPRERNNPMNHAARYALEHRLYALWSRIDIALNTLTRVQKEAEKRHLDKIKADAAALQATITSNPRNDQDDDFLIDVLRERVQSLLFTFDTWQAPTVEQEREARALEALAGERLGAVDRFIAAEVDPAKLL